jgi:hypothetical protein
VEGTGSLLKWCALNSTWLDARTGDLQLPRQCKALLPSSLSLQLSVTQDYVGVLTQFGAVAHLASQPFLGHTCFLQALLSLHIFPPSCFSICWTHVHAYASMHALI